MHQYLVLSALVLALPSLVSAKTDSNGAVHTTVVATTIQVVTEVVTDHIATTQTVHVAPAGPLCEQDDEDGPDTAYTASETSRGGSTATQAGSSSTATATLLPAVHWDQDTANLDHLQPAAPGDAVPLFYAEDRPSDQAASAFIGSMTPTFNHTTVVLDHSGHISTITFDPVQGALTVVFDCSDAYATAAGSWNNTKDPLLLITFTPGCGNYAGGERCFFEVIKVKFDPTSLSVTAVGTAQDYNDIVEDVTIEWGMWSPPSALATPTAFSTSPQAAPTATASAAASAVVSSCVPPQDTVYNLPTACLGDNFDDDLDDDLGYGNLEEFAYASYVKSLAADLDVVSPGLPNGTEGNFTELPEQYRIDWAGGLPPDADDELWYPDSPSRRKRSNDDRARYHRHAKRFFGFRLLDKDFTYQMPFSVPSQSKVSPNSKSKVGDSPWGKQLLLASLPKAGTKAAGNPGKGFTGSLNMYCVDCGAKGNLGVRGRIRTRRIGVGVEEAWMEFSAALFLGLKIGMEAGLEYNYGREETELFSVPLTTFTIPGAFTLGPRITVSADYAFKAAAYGKLLVGAEYTLPPSTWKYDFVTKQTTQSGWTSEFRPIFETDGEISLSAEVGLPVGIRFGLTALGNRFEASVGLVDRPSLQAAAQLSARIGLDENNKIDSGFTSANGCQGISTGLSWRNELYVQAVMKKFLVLPAFDKRFPIYDTQPRKLAQNCIALGSKAAAADGAAGNTVAPATKVNTRSAKFGRQAASADSISFTDPEILAAAYESDGTDFTGLISEGVRMLSCPDDNLYIDSRFDDEDLLNYCTELYRFKGERVVADGSSQLLVYYENTMSPLGISRLRTVDAEEIPFGAIYLSLLPRADGRYVAVDPLGEEFQPVVCSYKDSSMPARVFLVSDPDEDMATLKSKDVVYSVTGGLLNDCAPLKLRSGSKNEHQYLGGVFEDNPTAAAAVAVAVAAAG